MRVVKEVLLYTYVYVCCCCFFVFVFVYKWIAWQGVVVEAYGCVQYVNQSQNRGWGMEGEGGE